MSKVEARERAPVVSSDSSSPEASLARNAATLAFQTKSDAVFDTVIERFENQANVSTRLAGIALGLGVILLVLLTPTRRK